MMRHGEIWWCALDPVLGREQGKLRPCIIISDDSFNKSAIGLVVIIPLTSKYKPNLWSVKISADTSGLAKESYALPFQIRAVSRDRIQGQVVGTLSDALMLEIKDLIKVLLCFE